ncbi:MAG TPA: hypothetical protein VHB74_07615 [Devosia sp.]|nr:hypothetical protein [Devosia sp.]
MRIPLTAGLLAAPLLAALAGPAVAAPADGFTEACRLVYPQVGSSKSIIWAGTNGNRTVVLGLDGDRLECVFADGGTAPTLSSLQVVGPAGGVAAYAGRRLAEWNKLIGEHFGTAATQK